MHRSKRFTASRSVAPVFSTTDVSRWPESPPPPPRVPGRGVIAVVAVTSNIDRFFPFQALLPAASTGLHRDSKDQAEQVRLNCHRGARRGSRAGAYRRHGASRRCLATSPTAVAIRAPCSRRRAGGGHGHGAIAAARVFDPAISSPSAFLGLSCQAGATPAVTCGRSCRRWAPAQKPPRKTP